VFGAEDYPGVSFLQDGKPSGLFPHILAGVSKYSGDTYDLQLLPWKRAQNHATQGKGAIAHFSKTREREEQFDFSNLVYGDRIQLVVLKGKEFPFKELQDLKGKRIGAKLGASFGQKADTYLSTDVVEVQRDPGVNSRLNKLLLHRIDVAIVEGADGDIEKLIANDAALMQSKEKFVFLPEPLADDALYLAFAKGMNRKDALDRFNMGLVKFKKSDSYKKLLIR
jgi:ABC-type amino acid transport substrate-binding protein